MPNTGPPPAAPPLTPSAAAAAGSGGNNNKREASPSADCGRIKRERLASRDEYEDYKKASVEAMDAYLNARQTAMEAMLAQVRTYHGIVEDGAFAKLLAATDTWPCFPPPPDYPLTYGSLCKWLDDVTNYNSYAEIAQALASLFEPGNTTVREALELMEVYDKAYSNHQAAMDRINKARAARWMEISKVKEEMDAKNEVKQEDGGSNVQVETDVMVKQEAEAEELKPDPQATEAAELGSPITFLRAERQPKDEIDTKPVLPSASP